MGQCACSDGGAAPHSRTTSDTVPPRRSKKKPLSPDGGSGNGDATCAEADNHDNPVCPPTVPPIKLGPCGSHDCNAPYASDGSEASTDLSDWSDHACPTHIHQPRLRGGSAVNIYIQIEDILRLAPNIERLLPRLPPLDPAKADLLFDLLRIAHGATEDPRQSQSQSPTYVTPTSSAAKTASSKNAVHTYLTLNDSPITRMSDRLKTRELTTGKQIEALLYEKRRVPRHRPALHPTNSQCDAVSDEEEPFAKTIPTDGALVALEALTTPLSPLYNGPSFTCDMQAESVYSTGSALLGSMSLSVGGRAALMRRGSTASTRSVRFTSEAGLQRGERGEEESVEMLRQTASGARQDWMDNDAFGDAEESHYCESTDDENGGGGGGTGSSSTHRLRRRRSSASSHKSKAGSRDNVSSDSEAAAAAAAAAAAVAPGTPGKRSSCATSGATAPAEIEVDCLKEACVAYLFRWFASDPMALREGAGRPGAAAAAAARAGAGVLRRTRSGTSVGKVPNAQDADAAVADLLACLGADDLKALTGSVRRGVRAAIRQYAKELLGRGQEDHLRRQQLLRKGSWWQEMAEQEEHAQRVSEGLLSPAQQRGDQPYLRWRAKSISNRAALLGPMEASHNPDGTHVYTVVLDLDETLIYTRGDEAHLCLRPGSKELLRCLRSLNCEIIVWTASTKAYSAGILANLDPNLNYISECIYRHEKWYQSGRHDSGARKGAGHPRKDLSLLNRDLDRTIIVDNSVECCYGYTDTNSVIVPDFCGLEIDETLYCLAEMFIELVRLQLPVKAFLREHGHKYCNLEEVGVLDKDEKVPCFIVDACLDEDAVSFSLLVRPLSPRLVCGSASHSAATGAGEEGDVKAICKQ